MIVMKSEPQAVKSILKSTKAIGWCEIKTGDILTFSLPLKSTKHAVRGGCYVTYIKVKNHSSGKEWEMSLSNMEIVQNFDLV